MSRKCECSLCECASDAGDTVEDGLALCDPCAEPIVRHNGTDCCASKHDGNECVICFSEIKWGRIQTCDRGSGGSNYRCGACWCSDWTETEAGPGNPWELSGETREDGPSDETD